MPKVIFVRDGSRCLGHASAKSETVEADLGVISNAVFSKAHPVARGADRGLVWARPATIELKLAS